MSDPASATTLIDVLDTAVKIGGGAVVAGLFGWLIARASHRNTVDLARLNHKNTLAQRQFDDRRTLLLQITKQFDQCSLDFHQLVSFRGNVMRKHGAPEVTSAKDKARLKEFSASNVEASRQIQTVKLMLTVLDEPIAAKSVGAYSNFTHPHQYNLCGESYALTAEEYAQIMRKLHEHKDEVLALLAAAYKRTG